MANTNSASSGNENVVFSPTFLLPAAFPGMTGIELNRHQISNLVNAAGFPAVSIHQQPQQQQQQMVQTGVKNEMHQTKGTKGHRNNQHQQQQQLLQQQQLTPQLLTAVAFPGNPQHIQSNQQQIHNQGGHQQHIIAALPISGGGHGRSNQYNNNCSVWACPACKSSFKSATELQTHLSNHTKTEKSVPCATCGKLFASAERVRIHVRVAHGEKSCACDICGSGFSYRCKLMDHMRTHTGDKPFRCESCGRSFSQKNHLRRHQMIHTGERPFPCEVCGRGFYRKDKLNRHRRIHQNPVAGTANAGTSANATIGTGRGSKNSAANNTANNSTVTLPQQLTVAASTATGQTIQLVPLNVGHFQGGNLAAATQQWVISQQRIASANVTSNSTAANGSSSNASTPTTSS